MDVTIQEMRSRYESMDDWKLVDIYRNSDLTDIAKKTIDEEFQKRRIDPETWEEPIDKNSNNDDEILVKEKKKGWKIRNKDDALETVRGASTFFLIVAAIQAAIGIFIMPSMIFDAVIISVFAVVLRRWKSRVAATLIFFVSIGMVVVTISNIAAKAQGGEHQGGGNIIMALLMMWASIKAIEATFKLHGKYAKQSSQENTNES